jgi:hypothetical protein
LGCDLSEGQPVNEAQRERGTVGVVERSQGSVGAPRFVATLCLVGGGLATAGGRGVTRQLRPAVAGTSPINRGAIADRVKPPLG